jgi:AcrR family transcriptional regulator
MDSDVQVKTKREKLLDTAEELFFDKGYENVSVRELTSAAGVNVAAINYYFQSKENLYRESVRRRLSFVADDLISAMKREIYRDDPPDLRTILSVYINEYMGNILMVKEAGRFMVKEAGRFIETISRDMSEGGIITDILIEEMVEPVHMILKDAITRVRPDLPEDKISLCIISIGGQMFHFMRAREIIRRITGKEYNIEFLTKIIDHIIDFSLKGIGQTE